MMHTLRVTCRLQVTPLLLGSLFTVGVKDCVPADCKVAEGGAMETVIPIIVTVVEPVAAELVTEAAAMVTVKLPAGGVAGAVYVVAPPLSVVVGDTDPQAAVAHDTVQATPLAAVSPVTVAVICAVAFACNIVALGGGTLTVIPGTLKFADTAVVPSAAAIAVIVTVKSPAGGMAGAV